MEIPTIRNIESLIQLEPGKTIVKHEVKRLTAPGENYGSLMLSVELTVKTQSGTEKVNTVAKMVPPNEFIQEIFNTQVTFRNEIGFYNEVVPTLQNFLRENGEKVVDFAAKYYGSRLNLNGGDKVDSDAVLVLENLKVGNFVTLERMKGLDFDAARLVLDNLAHLHAVSLALKLKKPKEFEGKIMPHLSPWQMPEAMLKSSKKSLGDLVDQLEEIIPFKERILTTFDRLFEKTEPREPWATVTHNDCWSNNNMFKMEGTKAVKSIMVDFQICSYGSPARDVVFFLFSTVKNHVIEEKYEELLKQYHQVFIQILEELKCDTSAFSFEAFQRELDIEAKCSQFGHIGFMLGGIYMDHGQVRELSELTSDTMDDVEPSRVHKEKLIFVVKEFVKRNWI